MLRSRFPPIALDQPGSARFDHVESVECSGSDADKEAVEEFWIRAVESRCEGLMIKVNDIHDSLLMIELIVVRYIRSSTAARLSKSRDLGLRKRGGSLCQQLTNPVILIY